MSYISFQQNDITEIKANTFSATTALEEVTLSNNRITMIETDAFAGLNKLRRILLFDNALTSLGGDFFSGGAGGNTLLFTFVRFGRNNIKQIGPFPESIFNSSAPKYVKRIDGTVYVSNSMDLYGNALTDIPGNTFTQQTSMRLLWLGKNKLTRIQKGTFDTLKELTLLDLSFNLLSELDAAVFQSLSRVEFLHLNSNRLRALPAGSFLTMYAKNLFLENAAYAQKKNLLETQRPC